MNPRSWSFCSGFVHGQNYDNIDKRICPKGRKGRKPESSSKHPFKGPALQYLYFGSTNNFSRRLKQHRKGQNSQLVSKLETLSGCTKFCLFPIQAARGFEMYLQRGSDPEFVKLYSRTNPTHQEQNMIGFKNSIFHGHVHPGRPYAAKKSALMRLRVAIMSYSEQAHVDYSIRISEMATTY